MAESDVRNTPTCGSTWSTPNGMIVQIVAEKCYDTEIPYIVLDGWSRNRNDEGDYNIYVTTADNFATFEPFYMQDHI